MENSRKRKLAALTIQQKEIVELIQEGSKQIEVCRLKNVSAAVVNRIWKNCDDIEKQFRSGKGNIKKQKKCNNDDVETALLSWIKAMGDKKIPLNGIACMIQANAFAKELGYDWKCYEIKYCDYCILNI
jgi:hypothetical protein